MNIVGFAGPAGCGKTTLAKLLVEQHGYTRLSFAGPLKAALAAMGLPEPAGLAGKEAIIPWLGVSWRHCAQTLGTEWGRKLVNQNLWVLATMAGLKHGGKYVFDDVRFENESDAIREVGGNLVHIKGRAGDVGSTTKAHASETGIRLDVSDMVFYNEGFGLTELGSIELPKLLRALGV